MIKTTDQILNDALALSPKSRAKLAERLLACLDDPKQKEIDALWAQEAEDRIQAFEEGKLESVPGKEVFRRLRSRKTK